MRELTIGEMNSVFGGEGGGGTGGGSSGGSGGSSDHGGSSGSGSGGSSGLTGKQKDDLLGVIQTKDPNATAPELNNVNFVSAMFAALMGGLSPEVAALFQRQINNLNNSGSGNSGGGNHHN